MKKQLFILGTLLFGLMACNKDHLNSFEKNFEGKWLSGFYVIDGADYSSKYKADLTLSDDKKYILHYQRQDGALSYILYYNQEGSWQGNIDGTALEFEEINAPWTNLSATLQTDSLVLTGLLLGKNAEIRFGRQ